MGNKTPVLGSQPWRKFTPLIQIPQSDPDFRCCSEETVVNHIYYQSQVADVDVPILLFSAPHAVLPIQPCLQGTKFPGLQHTVPKHEQAPRQLCPYQTASLCRAPDLSSNATPGSRAAAREEGPGVSLTTLGLKGG